MGWGRGRPYASTILPNSLKNLDFKRPDVMYGPRRFYIPWIRCLCMRWAFLEAHSPRRPSRISRQFDWYDGNQVDVGSRNIRNRGFKTPQNARPPLHRNPMAIQWQSLCFPKFSYICGRFGCLGSQIQPR